MRAFLRSLSARRLTSRPAPPTRAPRAEAMAEAGVRLIVFAGGDGTARDMAAVLDDRVPVVGVPAGVKMHSAVYATSPRAAADLALRALDAEEIDARPRGGHGYRRGGLPRRCRLGQTLRLFVGALRPRPHPEREGGRGQQRPRGPLRGRSRDHGPNGGRAALHPGAGHHPRALSPRRSVCRRRCSASIWCGTGRCSLPIAPRTTSCARWRRTAPAQSSSPPSAVRATSSGAATSRSARAW